MRVLQVINSLKAGGAEKLLVDAIKGYVANGIDVDVLLLDGLRTDSYLKLKKVSGVKIFDLGSNNNVYSPQNILKIIKYLKGYDVVHVHLFPASYFVALANLSLKTTSKLVFTEHNTTNRRRKSRLWKPLETFIYKQYDAIVTISDAVDASLKVHLGDSGIVLHKIYNGIDLNEIDDAVPYSKKELGYDADVKLILQVSSFTAQKDQATLINAVKLLEGDFHLLLVGQGALKEKCLALVNDLHIKDKVHFLGYRNDVPRLLKTVDVVVLSSHFEGLSLASVEGLASSKPFVASRVPGLEDIVAGAGLLFEDGDHQRLAEIVQGLINDEELYQTTANKGFIKSRLFDIKKMVAKYHRLYKSLVL